MKHFYKAKRFRAESLGRIGMAGAIIDEYSAQGFTLTLRQLYYQFVARDLLPNTVKSYNNLVTLISDARLAGLIDWDAIEDRTRQIHSEPHWGSPQDIVSACAEQFTIDRWADQPYYVEVWIEKDALLGVIEGVCTEFDVPYFSCRGYTSQSAMWAAAQRMIAHEDAGQTALVLHLGDHDPSGMDMTRDIQDRLELFETDATVRRIALNEEQVEQYEPPPNPAKVTDSRFQRYAEEYGDESWELDALTPQVLSDLIRATIDKVLNQRRWKRSEKRQQRGRRQLKEIAQRCT